MDEDCPCSRAETAIYTILQLPVWPASSHDQWPLPCFLYICLTLFKALKQHFPVVRQITGFIAFPFTHLGRNTADFCLGTARAGGSLELRSNGGYRSPGFHVRVQQPGSIPLPQPGSTAGLRVLGTVLKVLWASPAPGITHILGDRLRHQPTDGPGLASPGQGHGQDHGK